MDENQFKEYVMPYMIKWIQWLKFENIEFNYMENFFEFFKGKKINNLNIDFKKWIKIKNVYNWNFFVDTNNNIILNKINSNIYSHTSIYNLKENKLNLYNGSFVAISKDYLLTKNSGILNLNLYDLQKKTKLYKIDNEMKNISLGYIFEKKGIIYLINGKEIRKYNLYTGKHIKTMDYNKYISTIKEIDGNIIYGTTDGNIITENKIIKISDEPIRKIVETEKYIIILSGMDELSILEKNTLKIIKNINNNEYIHDISTNKKIQALYILYEKGIIRKINLKDFKVEYEKNAGFDPVKNKVILTEKYLIKSDDDYINFYLLEDNEKSKRKDVDYKNINLKEYKKYEENIKYYNIQNGYEIIENEYAELTIKKEGQIIFKKELEDYLSKIKIIKDKLFISCENGAIELYNINTGKLLYKDKKIQKIADFDGEYIYYGIKIMK